MPNILKKGILRLTSYQARKKFFSFFFILPWIVGFLTLTTYPLFQTLLYSFNKTRTSTTEGVLLTPVGIENYKNVLLVDPDFKRNLIEYLQQMLFLVPIIIIFSVIVAVLLNVKTRFKRVYRAIYFLPVILTSGPLLEHITRIGATQISGMETFVVFRFIQDLPSVVSTPIMYVSLRFVYILWFSGVQILICLSALQKVDNNIYQAAMVDGASSWQAFFEITIPILRPFILLNAVYTIVDLSTSPLNGFQTQIKTKMFDS
jgi:oligogalacturonide transport system permease protein